MEDIKVTALLECHRQAGARLVDFAGYRMPLQYSGIVDEHRAVRSAAGIFDVSHMGQVFFRGPEALAAVDALVTNNVSALADGHALYTPICQPDGGIVDDCLVYRRTAQDLMIIVNASNRAKDFEWFKKNSQANCDIVDESDAYALIALQGPLARQILAAVSPSTSNIERFTFADYPIAGAPCTIARTGYTGEDGFEILCANGDAVLVWEALLQQGTLVGLKPCGLGARDTLRLEARLLLYGNDIDSTTTPLEAGIAWTVKLDNTGDFIGKQALIEQRNSGVERKLVGLVMRSRGIARHGYTIHRMPADFDENVSAATPVTFGAQVGEVTSGTQSPSLNQAVAMGYVSVACAAPKTRLLINVRGKPVQAEVVKGPFYSAKQAKPKA